MSLTALLVIDQRRLIKRVIERNGRQRLGVGRRGLAEGGRFDWDILFVRVAFDAVKRW